MATRNSSTSSRKRTTSQGAKRKTTSSRSKAASSRKKRTSKRRSVVDYTNNGVYDEIILFVMEAVFLILLLADFNLIGAVGEFFKNIQFGLFGLLAYVFPILMMVGAFFIYANMGNPSALVRIISSAVLFVDCGMISHMLVLSEQTALDMSIYKYSSTKCKGGGVVGGGLVNLLVGMIGKAGTVVVIILVFIICFMLITGMSIIDLASIGGEKARSQARESYDRGLERYEERQRRRAEREAKRALLDEEADEDEKILRMNMKAPKGVPLNPLVSGKNQENGDIREIVLPESEYLDEPEEPVHNDVFEQGSDDFVEQPREVDEKSELYAGYENEPAIFEEVSPAQETASFGIHKLSGEEFDFDSFEFKLEERLKDNLEEESAFNEKFEPEKIGPEKVEPEIFEPEPIASEDEFNLPPVESEASIWKSSSEPDDNRSTNSGHTFSKPKAVAADNSVAAQAKKSAKHRSWVLPKANARGLLVEGKKTTVDSTAELKETARKLQETLGSFGVKVEMTACSKGPTVTRYEMKPETGVKVSKIVGLADDIKLSLAAADVRIEAPIPGKSAVGIEVPNKDNSTVMIRDLLESKEFTDFSGKIAFAVGKGLSGETVVADIGKMPHVLVAGATGSGKSVCINTLIMSILFKYTPDEIKLIMIDPKVVELSVYNGIPHLMIPVVTDPKQASAALRWGVTEMTNRYEKFANAGVRDLKGYNEKVKRLNGSDPAIDIEPLPQIVIIVDELADLMMTAANEVEESICRLAQLARACGIHLVIATQRPSVDVITGLIKANMPSRIAFSVSSGVDSRTILDMVGAEKLLGKGDMLFYPQGYTKPARLQGAFVSDDEVSAVVDFWKNQVDGSDYNAAMQQEITSSIQAQGGAMGAQGAGINDRDEYFTDAGRFIIEKDKASIGMLQRMFKIGFNRAARIMDQLADAGVVGEEEGTKPRKVLMSLEEFENHLEQGDF